MKVTFELGTSEFNLLATSGVFNTMADVLGQEEDKAVSITQPRPTNKKEVVQKVEKTAKEEPPTEVVETDDKAPWEDANIDVEALLDEAKKVLGGMMKQGKTKEVADLLKAFGATKLSEVKANELQDLIDKAKGGA